MKLCYQLGLAILALAVSDAALAQNRVCNNQTLLRDLIRTENNADQGRNNYRLVQTEARKFRIRPCDAGSGFMKILASFDNKNTVDAREAFVDLMYLFSRTKNRRSFFIFADHAVRIRHYENTSEDAAGNIRFVRTTMAKKRFSPGGGLMAMANLLKIIGKTETVTAQQTFAALASMRDFQKVQLRAMVPEVARLNAAENRVEDTLSSVQLVRKSVLANRMSAVKGLRLITNLTRQAGATNTADAQSDYRLLVWGN